MCSSENVRTSPPSPQRRQIETLSNSGRKCHPISQNRAIIKCPLVLDYRKLARLVAMLYGMYLKRRLQRVAVKTLVGSYENDFYR